MSTKAVDDLLDWASKLAPWKQDALRRLAANAKLSDTDHGELLALLKSKVGIAVAGAPTPTPLAATHIGTVFGGAPIQLKEIRGVQHVNQLLPNASLPFSPTGLTIVYGRNGSGKSGFVRIFRTACRTRIEKADRLKVLADVYGSPAGPQQAEIVVVKQGVDIPIKWSGGKAASDDLLQVSVFDSASAQLYIDEGNQIRFLPFGLALPHRLNDLCLTLRTELETEAAAVEVKLALAKVQFASERETKAQLLYRALKAASADKELDDFCVFSQSEDAREQELTKLLAGIRPTVASLTEFAEFLESAATEADDLSSRLSDASLTAAGTLKKTALSARADASLKAEDLFADEPLDGVGGDTWRKLWLAARDYSVSVAYEGQPFPVTEAEADGEAVCVLCQQEISAAGAGRLSRFAAFMADALSQSAADAEASVAKALVDVPALKALAEEPWKARADELKKRDGKLAHAVAAFLLSANSRRATIVSLLSGAPSAAESLPPINTPAPALRALAKLVRAEATVLSTTKEEEVRAQNFAELCELVDKRLLTQNLATLKSRRDLMKERDFLTAALAEVQTTGTTKKANDLIDTHLKADVLKKFAHEQKALEIDHLKVGLERKSGQKQAEFQTTTGTKLTRLTSEILSEGEQRALALAAFFTEVAVTEGSGPIVIDDPVSSLDRDRGQKVAARLVEEASARQVVVFTHDLVFFNDLCRMADSKGVTASTIALFRDQKNAGKVDPAGVIWKGAAVLKRLGPIKNDFAPLRKLHGTSPADYEFKVKGLYGRIRDCYERVVEELIFFDVVRRGVDRVETQKLRFVHLSHDLAIRFHEGMTKANTHSHDNPAADTVAVPDPMEFDSDVAFLETLIADLKTEHAKTEAARPSMKPAKD